MKQATGELNATVVVMLAIGVFIAFFYYTLWPLIRNNFKENARCSEAICEPCPTHDCKTVTCYTKNSDHSAESGFECVYKG